MSFIVHKKWWKLIQAHCITNLILLIALQTEKNDNPQKQVYVKSCFHSLL